MDKQGAHRTYSIPKRYKDQFHMVQNSQTPVVWIMDVDATKIGVGVKQTTLSGRCQYWPLAVNYCLYLLGIPKVSK